jgi:dihydroxyacetone kinase-like protein
LVNQADKKTQTLEKTSRVAMKKLMNEPSAFVDQMLEGLLLAHPDQLKSVGGTNRALVRTDAPVAGKVAIVTGGGSGHLPVFVG